MFDSLKEMLRFPCTVHVAGVHDAFGDISYTTRHIKAYRVNDSVRIIEDDSGDEILSKQHIYTEDANIGASDMLSFPEEPTPCRIRRRTKYFDGLGQGGDIWVIYL